MVMTCNLCTDGNSFAVPYGDGIGEALMADHLEAEHGEHGPSDRLRAYRRASRAALQRRAAR